MRSSQLDAPSLVLYHHTSAISHAHDFEPPNTMITRRRSGSRRYRCGGRLPCDRQTSAKCHALRRSTRVRFLCGPPRFEGVCSEQCGCVRTRTCHTPIRHTALSASSLISQFDVLSLFTAHFPSALERARWRHRRASARFRGSHSNHEEFGMRIEFRTLTLEKK